MSAHALRVEWVNGNQQWMILGGGLPAGAAWDGFDTLGEALAEAYAIADDIGVEVIDQPSTLFKRHALSEPSTEAPTMLTGRQAS
jgi:hypothetical protein